MLRISNSKRIIGATSFVVRLRLRGLNTTSGNHLVPLRLRGLNTTSGNHLVPFPASLQVKSPQLKNRIITKTLLKNNIKTILISDPSAPSVAAALCVQSGSWKDPKSHEGIAHFLEHMVFLGSKTYPLENEYERFILDNNGVFNAYTASDHTLYYFENVNPDALYGSLDRFSRFFHEPLFKESCSDRERNAVNEEYKKNVREDGWRIHHVKKELANKLHPFSMFNTGNLDTMKLIDVDYLHKWFKENYSSHLMTLSILGREPIEKLNEFANDLFAVIPDNSIANEKITTYGSIFPESLNKSIVWIEPLKDLKELSITWEVPEDLISDENSKPGSLLSFILGHEGKNSLLSSLKEEELVQRLSAGKSELGANNYTFEISVTLTDKGVENWRTVIARIYACLTKFQNEGLCFPEYLYNEANQMRRLGWEWQQRNGGIVSRFASQLRKEELDSFPLKTLFIEKFDSKKVQALLDFLVPSKSWVSIVSKTLPSNSNITLTNKEKWMDVSYGCRSWSQEEESLWITSEWQKSNNALIKIPSPNRFMPNASSLDILDNPNSTPVPISIRDDELGTFYYYRDNKFLVPEAYMKFHICTPAIQADDPKSICLGELYVQFVDDVLNEISYEADSAGLHCHVWVKETRSIGVSLSGYSQKAGLYLEEILSKIKSPELLESKFEIFKESLGRSYRNAAKNSPVQQSFETLSSEIMQKFSTSSQLEKALQTIKFTDLKNFITNKLFAKTFIEGFVGGNVSKKDALNFTNLLTSKIGGSSVSKKESILKTKVKDFSNFKHPQLLNVDIQTKGNALVWWAELSNLEVVDRLVDRVLNQVLGKMMHEPFYSELRTKQQTGYMVHSASTRKDKRSFIYCAIQSNSHDPRDLLSRVELFLENFVRDLKEDPETSKRFETIKAAMISRLEDPHDSLNSKLNHLNDLAFEEEQDWDFLEKKKVVLQELTIEKLTSYASSALNKENKRRVAVACHGNDKENSEFSYRSLKW